jgi:hypothetical protein
MESSGGAHNVPRSAIAVSPIENQQSVKLAMDSSQGDSARPKVRIAKAALRRVGVRPEPKRR